jgi:hypothetical protein
MSEDRSAAEDRSDHRQHRAAQDRSDHRQHRAAQDRSDNMGGEERNGAKR